MTKERWSYLVVGGLLLVALVNGISSTGLLGNNNSTNELVMLNDLGELQREFNSNKQKTQLILLVSPT